MVKINYKGFVVEFDSVAEARAFIDRDEYVSKKIPKGFLPQVTVEVKKTRRRKFRRFPWTHEQISEIVSMLKQRASKRQIAISPIIKGFHSLGAARQMIWRVETNPSSNRKTLSPTLTAIINDYHANK